MIRNINVICVNAGKKMGDQVAWELIIRDVEDRCADWAAIFLVECDAWLEERHVEFDSVHEIFRYWPGSGRFPWQS